MPKLVLPSALQECVAQDQGGTPVMSPRSLTISARCWGELVHEVRSRFPELAQRVLGKSDDVAAGFCLVVNDEVVRRCDPRRELQTDDEVSFLPAMAGG